MFGPGSHLVVAHREGPEGKKSSTRRTVSWFGHLEQDVRWLGCHDTLEQTGTLFCLVRPGAKLLRCQISSKHRRHMVVIFGEAQRHTRAPHVPPTVSQREFCIRSVTFLSSAAGATTVSEARHVRTRIPSRNDTGNDHEGRGINGLLLLWSWNG